MDHHRHAGTADSLRRANRVDDTVTCTLGHEVMHLALGEYHR